MKVYVLYRGNDDLEQGGLYRQCIGVYPTKEKALTAFEQYEYDFWCDEYDDLDELVSIINSEIIELNDTGSTYDYTLFESELLL